MRALGTAAPVAPTAIEKLRQDGASFPLLGGWETSPICEKLKRHNNWVPVPYLEYLPSYVCSSSSPRPLSASSLLRPRWSIKFTAFAGNQNQRENGYFVPLPVSYSQMWLAIEEFPFRTTSLRSVGCGRWCCKDCLPPGLPHVFLAWCKLSVVPRKAPPPFFPPSCQT